MKVFVSKNELPPPQNYFAKELKKEMADNVDYQNMNRTDKFGYHTDKILI